jgi:hypothetical protein
MQPAAPTAVRVLRASTAEQARDREGRASRAEVPRQIARERCSRVSGRADGAACAPSTNLPGVQPAEGGALVFSRLHACASRAEVGTTGFTVAQRRPYPCSCSRSCRELPTNLTRTVRTTSLGVSRSGLHASGATRRAGRRRARAKTHSGVCGRRAAVLNSMSQPARPAGRTPARCRLHTKVR